jgi:hypothetical protein
MKLIVPDITFSLLIIPKVSLTWLLTPRAAVILAKWKILWAFFVFLVL